MQAVLALWARKYLGPVALVCFVLILSFPSFGLWLVAGTLKAAAQLAAFLLLFSAGLLALIIARLRFEKILEQSRRWEEVRDKVGVGAEAEAAPPAITSLGSFFLHSSVASVESKQPPDDILFSKWKLPLPVAKELGAGPLVRVCFRGCFSMHAPPLPPSPSPQAASSSSSCATSCTRGTPPSPRKTTSRCTSVS